MLRYAISDRARYGGREQYRQDCLVREAARWGTEGIEFVQIREKDLEAGELVALTRRVVAAVGRGTKVLVNGRVDVALAARAAGVHLTGGKGELTPAQVRTVFPDAVVSVSCHSVEEVRRARAVGADVVLFGPVFGKVVGGMEVVQGLGLAGLRQACAVAEVFALGGVTMADVQACESAGAVGVAGIRLFAGPA